MQSSSLFIAAALSVFTLGCAGSGVHTESPRLSRFSGGEGISDLWVPARESQSQEDIQVMYRSEATSDLWMKKGFESDTGDGRDTLTPRIDWVLNRLAPSSSITFVEASHPTTAHQ